MFMFLKAMDDNVAQKFTMNEISYFEVAGVAYYQRFIVSVSKDEIGINKSQNVNRNAVIDTVFLRMLQKGKSVTLFNYRDEIKNRFYIYTGNENPKELIYQLYQRNNRVITNELFKTQLTELIDQRGMTSAKTSWLVKKATYNNSSLLDIVSIIND